MINLSRVISVSKNLKYTVSLIPPPGALVCILGKRMGSISIFFYVMRIAH